jgi:integrase/recombinase XerD
MRYSGLRIGDATSAEVASLADGKLSRHTQKTGSHVYLEIPPEVVRALDEIPKASERFWFWSGNGQLETASKDWQGRLADLFEDAGIQDGHSHRFRHAFAKDHLSKGTSMQDLSKLLGHASIKVTEKYYAKWCTERQEKASAAMRRTWINDPVLAWEREANSTDAKLERADEAEPVSEEVEVAVPPASTRQVREKRRAVN